MFRYLFSGLALLAAALLFSGPPPTDAGGKKEDKKDARDKKTIKDKKADKDKKDGTKEKTPSRDKDLKDDLKDKARWEWTLRNAKGKEIDSGTFMGYRSGKITLGKNPIGTWKSLGPDQFTVTFTDSPLKGNAVMNLKRPTPVTYEGDLIRPDGAKQRLVIQIYND